MGLCCYNGIYQTLGNDHDWMSAYLSHCTNVNAYLMHLLYKTIQSILSGDKIGAPISSMENIYPYITHNVFIL